MHSPARRVSEVPELIALICDFAEKSSLVKLLTVSQRFFYCIAPLVWKEVPGVANLLALLPPLDTDLDLKEFLVVGPDDLRPCDQSQLARFITYAPFVQKLESNAKTDGDHRSWDLLLSRVPTRPLLPNLRALPILPYYRQGIPRFIEYIDAFLCSALSTVYVSPSYKRWMSPLEARDLLVRMVATCPNLIKLSIHPGNRHYPNDLSSLGPTSPISVFIHVSQFRDLQVFRSSSAVLNCDVLQLLGNLPCLESLAAYSLCTSNERYEDDEILIASLKLPEDSFPSLRNLEIDCVPGVVVLKLWQTPPLVRNIVSVRIQFMLGDTELLSDLVCAICRGSPHITDLELDLDQCDEPELSVTATEHLCRLPLRRIRIWNCYVDIHPLILALPNLEYLSIEGVYVSFEELALIAKYMPKLQYLSSRLVMWPAEHALPPIPPGPSSLVPCHIDIKLDLNNDFQISHPMFDKLIDNIARYLHTLWPSGVRLTLWNADGGYRRERDSDIMERVNRATKALSGTSALDVPTEEESKSRWLYKLQ
ncbi:hypothetical protein BDV93DRAFT_551877 [Ceratobasidium sp. AG-I]|nr:hypothetical protein BDV93DRAFT_551877 [Ceratobasidium sp. AG-I]